MRVTKYNEETKWAYNNRIPLRGMLEITNVCNFKCVHCYVTNAKNQTIDFLPFDIIKSVVDELQEMGCKYLTLTGGECTLHPDFEKIYSYIFQKGIKVSVFTNASLITEKSIALFTKYVPDTIEVSLYGASEETYQKVTKATQFKDVINGLELFSNSGVNLILKMIVLKQNEHELDLMKELASKYTNNPLRTSYDLMPSYDFSQEVLENHTHLQNSINSYSVKGHTTNKQAFRCYAGRSFFSINAHGNVSLCTFCGFSAMSLKQYSFHDIWESFNEKIKLLIPKDSECYDCKFINECWNCPARTWMFHQKIGLYPIPQCKKKTENGVTNMGIKKKKMIPGSYTFFERFYLYRDEDGNIAVDETWNKVIKTAKKDKVELIKFENDSEIDGLWKIENKFYVLCTGKEVNKLPGNAMFDKCYRSNNYENGLYVKYHIDESYGILYVSDTEVSVLLFQELDDTLGKESFIDIDYEDGLFYAKNKDGSYTIFDEGLNKLGIFPDKVKKVENYNIFLYQNKIYCSSTIIEAEGIISSIERVTNVLRDRKNGLYLGEVRFWKVITEKGMYLYTFDSFQLIAGPLPEYSEIKSFKPRECYITYDFLNEHFFGFYWEDKENYFFKSISSENSLYVIEGREFDFLYCTDGSLYEINKKEKFEPIATDLCADSLKLTFIKNTSKIRLVGFKNCIPTFSLIYDEEKESIIEKEELDVHNPDSANSKFLITVKGKNEIVLMNCDGCELFRTSGKTCKVLSSKDAKTVYYVEDEEGYIKLFNQNGKVIC